MSKDNQCITDSYTVDSGTSACAACEVPAPSRLVTRDETSNPINIRNRTDLIDCLAFTIYPEDGRDWRWLQFCLREIFLIQP